jgi:hypothetical protein
MRERVIARTIDIASYIARCAALQWRNLSHDSLSRARIFCEVCYFGLTKDLQS